jgi:hypothetical protein
MAACTYYATASAEPISILSRGVHASVSELLIHRTPHLQRTLHRPLTVTLSTICCLVSFQTRNTASAHLQLLYISTALKLASHAAALAVKTYHIAVTTIAHAMGLRKATICEIRIASNIPAATSASSAAVLHSLQPQCTS